MSVDFGKIPECVFELFAEIMWADPENRGREVTLKPNDRAKAYGIAWGWNPPLMEVGSETSLTHYGLAADAWHQLQAVAESTSLSQRLMVDLPRMMVTLDGTELDAQSENALRWIQVLANRPGEWISASQLEEYDKLLYGIRPDRHCKPYLPVEILNLIDTDRRKGSRLRLP